MELSTYLNVRHMAFVVGVIKPEKIGLFCCIHFIDGYNTTTLYFIQTK